MLIADTTLAFEPTYPWSIPTIGPFAMLGVAVALTTLTLWTYLGVRQATWRRVVVVLLLRLGALAIAFSILVRPSVAVTQLEGVEGSKLLVIFDASASMNVTEIDGKSTRWQQVDEIWKSKSVERRLRQLRESEKVEIVRYLGSEDLRADEKDVIPNGPRTDIGAWLGQLWDKHGQDKHVRGVVLFSDGADNGTRFSALEKARRWRGIAPIHTFGVGDPANARFKKDLGLTKLDVKPEPIYVGAPIKIEATFQAPGFDKAEFKGSVWIQGANEKEARPLMDLGQLRITEEKGQKIKLDAKAPTEAGEYKVTVKITPHAEETNQGNNEISTYFQVGKEVTHVLWVDRPRVYEPTRIIQLALAPEDRLKVHFVEVRPDTVGDPIALYQLDRPYDVIVIGDISAKQFSLGQDKVFERIKKMVNAKTGLLMLGGAETFAKGGWQNQPAIMSLLPVDLDLKGKKADFLRSNVRAAPPEALKGKHLEQFSFLRLDPKIWAEEFGELDGIAPLGNKMPGATELLHGPGKELVMAATQAGGRVVVFAGDSTAEKWFDTDDAAKGFTHFWTNLVLYLANREDQSTPLALKLDKRRIAVGGADVLGFTMALRDKAGDAQPGIRFTAKVVRVGGTDELPVRVVGERGAFQGAKEPGEYQLFVEAKEHKASARFTVAVDDIETLRPLADHETLRRIASAGEGRFHPANEEAFLLFLDELGSQVHRESRHKTVHWPDWRRVPASESARDQLTGIWSSFALVGMALFVGFLCGEWLLRRMWGLV